MGDGSGLWVCAKRLVKGRFRWPAVEGKDSVTMRAEELAMLVNGLDVKHIFCFNQLRRARRNALLTLNPEAFAS